MELLTNITSSSIVVKDKGIQIISYGKLPNSIKNNKFWNSLQKRKG